MSNLPVEASPQLEDAAVIRELHADPVLRGNRTERGSAALNAEIRISRLGMVENVRRVHTDFHLQLLVDPDPLRNGHVQIPESGPEHPVAEVAELARARGPENQLA